jgi:hypothetical protein
MLDPSMDTLTPDWLATRSDRATVRALDQIRLTIAERDQFYKLVYGDLRTPASVIRHLAESYLSGAPVPIIAKLGPPRAHEPLTAPDGKSPVTVSIYFALPRDHILALRARARAQGASVSAVLRRYVLAYLRDAKTDQSS